MRRLITVLLVCIALVALGADISQAEKKRKPNKSHPWYPNCTTNFDTCHNIACNFPGDPSTSGKDECQFDCLNELDKCLGRPARTRRETGITGGNPGAGVDPGTSPRPQSRPEGAPKTGGISPN